MRIALAGLLLLTLAVPARAQQPPPPPVVVPPAPPTVTLTAAELDALIQALADTPARWSLQPLQFLLARRQAATAPAHPEPKAP